MIDNVKDIKNTYDLESAVGLVKDEITKALESSPAVIRDYTSHLSKATGKLIRAKSLLICSQDEDEQIQERAVKVAAAIEIFHLATLVHDDIIDDAPLRRGIATLNRKYGTRTAVICGDYLLSMAMGMITSVFDNDRVPEIKMANLLGKLCLGELTQHINNGNYSLSVMQYLKIIAGKTAALFEVSFYLGAHLAGNNHTESRKYARIGRYIGMIFQLTDDCMDYEASEQVAMKPVLSDFEQDVVTLPLIYALKASEDLRNRARSGKLSSAIVNKAVKMTGGLNFTRTLAKRYKSKAIGILEGLSLDNARKNNLSMILETSYRTF
ncbi:MAG TPA: polyprenyl synthetase family protein [Clostridia bacterium]|nr:polyprenyl synthetase family protein [Clostridia bacterium]